MVEDKVWPHLEEAQKIGCLSYVDLSLAKLLLRDVSGNDELAAGLICHLSKALREGHLCIRKQAGTLYPNPFDLWFNELRDDNSTADIEPFLSELIKSDIPLPNTVLTEVGECVSHSPITPICKYKELYYFQKYWRYESIYFEALTNLLEQKPSLVIDQERAINAVNGLQKAQKVNEEQAEALIKAPRNCLSIICGGPGTGKTYTAGLFIKIFWESLSEEQQKQCRIILAAPTGKAASHLKKSLESSLSGYSDISTAIETKTLHSLLKVHGSSTFNRKPHTKLKGDLFIVDESSMIDVRLFSYLLQSVKAGSRLILLGDPYQLPPVEVGAVFNDTVTVLKEKKPCHVFELHTCLRAELKEIIDFSSLVKEGNAAGILAHFSSQREGAGVASFKTPFPDKPRLSLEALIKYAMMKFPPYNPNINQLIESYQSFRVLTPLREGPFGVKEINNKIHRLKVSQIKEGEAYSTPIIVTTNDYKMELFNGEGGLLIQRKKPSFATQEEDYAVFPGPEGSLRKIPAILLPKYEYAYCLSVHKSQGSEFDHVLLLLPEGSERFGREVFYTAATRAKKQLEVWGSDHTLSQTATRKSERQSGIPWRLLYTQ